MSPKMVETYRADPLEFCRDFLGFEPWEAPPGADGQIDILRAVGIHDRVVVRSAQKTGKSLTAICLALWWVTTRPGSRVIITAPTFKQIKISLWSTLQTLCLESPFDFGVPAKDPTTGLIVDPLTGGGIFGITADKPESIAGYSGADQFYIVDEASGYSENIMEAIMGNLIGGGKLLLLGNPTQTSGTFFNAFNTGARSQWKTLHLRAQNNPNFRGGKVRGLMTPALLEVARDTWGEGTPAWEIRVEGNFPSTLDDHVIGLHDLEVSRWQDEPEDEGEILQLGVDPARSERGDDSVIAAVRGRKAYPLKIFKGYDTVQVANLVIATVRELKRPGEIPRILVDDIGIGAGVTDRLREHLRTINTKNEFEVLGINSAVRSGKPAEYSNLRSELAFNVRDWLKRGGKLPNDGRLEAELVSAKYSFDSHARKQIEPKEDIKKRIGRSPDRADAFALAVFKPSKGPVYRAGTTGEEGNPLVLEYNSPMLF